MSSSSRRASGFTLIELVMVIVIIGILAAIAVPQFYNLSTEAHQATEKAIVGAVRAGVLTYFVSSSQGNRDHYPSDLDGLGDVTASDANVFFDNVLTAEGIRENWTKDNEATGSQDDYTYDPTSNRYRYNPAAGTLIKQ